MSFSNTYKQHLNILIPYYRIRNLKKVRMRNGSRLTFIKMLYIFLFVHPVSTVLWRSRKPVSGMRCMSLRQKS